MNWLRRCFQDVKYVRTCYEPQPQGHYQLAMNPNRKVTTVCYGKKQEWDDREEAQAYFLEAMMNSDGAQHDRYSGIYIQLQNGLDYCTDEDDDEEDES